MSQQVKKLWRNSATLVILGRNWDSVRVNKYDYKVLMIERSAKLSFPSMAVFPGGVAEKSDEFSNWSERFKRFGLSGDDINCLEMKTFEKPHYFNQTLANDLSARITAIRETFEEVGILIGKHKNGGEISLDRPVKDLQTKISADARNFIEMCDSLNVVPDLFNLHVWSAWLTPPFVKHRFAAVMYLTTLQSQPKVSIVDSNEVARSLWETPAEILRMYQNKEINLPPPQFYELTRLSKVHDMDKVVEVTKLRNETKGVLYMFPLVYSTRDDQVHLYPGDDFYPTEPDFYAVPDNVDAFSEMTAEEFRQKAVNLHRAEQSKQNSVKIFCNAATIDDELSPVTTLSNKL